MLRSLIRVVDKFSVALLHDNSTAMRQSVGYSMIVP